MRSTRTVLLIGALMVLASCKGHEAMTGSYGTRVVTGQVVMAGTSASPEGVRASVVGTGMSTVLGPDGRFTFTGVPDNATLSFSSADGVSTRVMVPQSQTAPLVVQLDGSGNHGHRRAVPGGALLQIEGLVKTAAADSVVVTTEHGDVTVKVTDTTVIRKGMTPVAATDLQPNWRVHVKASVQGDVNTAMEIIVQDQGNGTDDGSENDANIMTANGLVTAVADGSLVVSTVPKGDVTVQVDDSTIIRKQGDVVHLDAIQVGDYVNTMGTKVDDHTLKAIQIEVRGNGVDNPGNGQDQNGGDHHTAPPDNSHGGGHH